MILFPFITIPLLVARNWNKISSIFSGIGDSLSFLGDMFEPVSEEFHNFTNAMGMLKNMVLGIWSAMPSEFKEILILAMVNPILGLGSLIWNSFAKVYTNVKSRMGESGRSFLSAFTQGMIDSVADLKESVGKVFAVIARFLPHSDAVEGPLSQITKSGRAFVTTFVSGMNSARNTLRPAIVEAMQEVKNGVSGQDLLSQAWEGFKNIGSNIVDKASASMEVVKDFGKKSGQALIETFSSGIDSAKDLIDGSIGKVFAKSKEQFPQSNAKRGAFANLTGSGKALVETFSEGIQSSAGLLNLILGKFFIPKTIDPVMGTGNNIVNNESNSRQITIQTNKLVEIIINDSSLDNLSPESLGKLLLDAINKEISRYEVFV